MQKIDWVVLGGIAIGGIVGIFLLNTVVPVVAKPLESKKQLLTTANMVPAEYPFDSPEGWNWDLNMEKISKNYEIDATQNPYWNKMANEYYNPHNVY